MKILKRIIDGLKDPETRGEIEQDLKRGIGDDDEVNRAFQAYIAQLQSHSRENEAEHENG